MREKLSEEEATKSSIRVHTFVLQTNRGKKRWESATRFEPDGHVMLMRDNRFSPHFDRPPRIPLGLIGRALFPNRYRSHPGASAYLQLRKDERIDTRITLGTESSAMIGLIDRTIFWSEDFGRSTRLQATGLVPPFMVMCSLGYDLNKIRQSERFDDFERLMALTLVDAGLNPQNKWHLKGEALSQLKELLLYRELWPNRTPYYVSCSVVATEAIPVND